MLLTWKTVVSVLVFSWAQLAGGYCRRSNRMSWMGFVHSWL
jgi:hypothetical protein